jgi:hypothetical protein
MIRQFTFKRRTIMAKTMTSRVAVVTAVALMFGAAPALAGEGKTAAGGSDQYKTAAPKTEGAGDFTGRHTMEGEVTRVDQSKGIMSLRTAEGTMDLHFPPSALANIKKGDRVAVELALKPAGGTSASPRTDKTPAMDKAPSTKK